MKPLLMTTISNLILSGLKKRDTESHGCCTSHQRYLVLVHHQRCKRYDLPRASEEFSSAIKIEQTIDAVVKQNAKLMEKKLAKKAREIEQQCKNRLSEELKERIQELQAQKEAQDIEIEEQKQATEQVLMQAQDMLKQKQEAFAENQTLQDQKAQLERELSQKVEEVKQAKDQNEKYQEEISKMSKEIKENTRQIEESKETIRDRIKSTHKDFDLDSTKLELNMKEEKTQKLVKAMEENKCTLGDMHKLTINNMINEDTILDKFMTYSAPSSLKLFVFNHSYLGENDKAVRIKFYLEGLKEILPRVTKEVYLECLVVEDTDLSQIVKWASNAERLTIRWSKKILFRPGSIINKSRFTKSCCSTENNNSMKLVMTASTFMNLETL
ncbi:unnamed protein product [Moneuplotes crassus]|uniref:Uncharacterized protein n=1 Tax=Euplotes crassus TaxID=5936 RepID=A0AAD1U3T7_EUPCR|nr:unnamed protein product [Moneuplotes crassus]